MKEVSEWNKIQLPKEGRKTNECLLLQPFGAFATCVKVSEQVIILAGMHSCHYPQKIIASYVPLCNQIMTSHYHVIDQSS